MASFNYGNPGQRYQPGYGFGFPTPTAPTPGFGYSGSATSTSPAVEWVPTTARDAHWLSDRAVVAGYEGYDNSPLWLIRARYENDLIPGKLAIRHNYAFVPWGGKENAVHNIEVCCARPGSVRWVESRHGACPPNAVIAGHTVSGETLYAGRAREQGSLTPGKVHPSHKSMYISFAGQEIAHRAYEVLCTVPASVEWVHTTPREAHWLSDRAVVAGYEGHDHSPLWVIRAKFENDLIPGKLAIKHNAAYVPWGGKENAVHNIEVCCAHPESVRWIESRHGACPPNAVVAGHTASGEKLYVGRARYQGSLTPGKVHPSHRAMYISFAGHETAHQVYDVLCTV